MSIVIGLAWLLVKLLVLALVWYGLKWLADYLAITIPDTVVKIVAAILVIIGLVMVIAFLMGIAPGRLL